MSNPVKHSEKDARKHKSPMRGLFANIIHVNCETFDETLWYVRDGRIFAEDPGGDHEIFRLASQCGSSSCSGGAFGP
jgi:hypothetical protein